MLGVTIAAFAYVVMPHYFARSRMGGDGLNGAANIRSIVVLPLENLSGDPAQDYFADGMTEALISNLTQIRLVVGAREFDVRPQFVHRQ